VSARGHATINLKTESEKAKASEEKKRKFVFIHVSLIDLNIYKILENLYDACVNGDLKKVKIILSKDSSLLNKALDEDGETALYVASDYSHSSIVTFLLKEENLDVNKANTVND
jgi:ankyrin repeat protein